MKIAAQLSGSFIAILLLTVFMRVFSISQLSKVNQVATTLKVSWMSSVRVASRLSIHASGFRSAESPHILFTDENEMAKYKNDMTDLAKAVARDNASYMKLNFVDAREKKFMMGSDSAGTIIL